MSIRLLTKISRTHGPGRSHVALVDTTRIRKRLVPIEKMEPIATVGGIPERKS